MAALCALESGKLHRDHKRPYRYDELVGQEWAFVGTPAQVIDKIGWLQERAGITEFDILANYGGTPHWQALKQQELFARQVMPAFR